MSKLEFDLLVKKNDLDKALKTAETQVQSISDMMKNGITSQPIDKVAESTSRLGSLMNGLATNITGVAIGMFVFEAIGKLVGSLTNQVTESIDAFADQEDSLNKLAQSLNVTGNYSKSAVDGLSRFASELESTTKYSDDAITKQIAFAKSLGATNEKAKDIVTAAANLSAALGGSLEENTEKLGKTLGGTAGKLGQLVPELKNLTAEQLRAGAATDIINQKFSGAAQSELTTYTGKLAALKNQYNNLQESVGKVIVESGFFQTILEKAKGAVDSINSTIATNAAIKEMQADYALTSRTSNQLASDTTILNDEIKKLQKSLEEQKNRSSFSKFIFDDDTSAVIQLRINDLVKLRSQIEEKLTYQSKATKQELPERERPRTEEEIEAEKKRQAEILAIQQTFAETKRQNDLALNNQLIADEALRNEAEILRMYEFDARKKEIEATLKEQQAEASLRGEALKDEQLKISLEKKLALLELANKKEIALTQNTQKESKRLSDAKAKAEIDNMQLVSQRTGEVQGFISAVLKDGSKEQFLINKAAAIAQIMIARSTGIANALLIPDPTGILQAAAITRANVTAGIALATVAATTIKGFARGGIIGASDGGDNKVVSVREGEMVLNASQQKTVFNAINSGSISNGDIVIQIDGREVFRAVKNQIAQGYKLA